MDAELKRITVEYDSNNSGGRWWLKDEDWAALESAGWNVDWVRDQSGEKRMFSRESDGNYRWLGALASKATLECGSLREAIESFELATHADASEEGCGCCGPPHCFSAGSGEDWQYVSGNEVVNILYPGSPSTLREAAALLRRTDGGES